MDYGGFVAVIFRCTASEEAHTLQHAAPRPDECFCTVPRAGAPMNRMAPKPRWPEHGTGYTQGSSMGRIGFLGFGVIGFGGFKP